MLIYAGIDEAGYGPLLGPLVIAAAVLKIEDASADAPAPDLWDHLHRGICRSRSEARSGRIAIADSKKLYTPKKGVRDLERGVLAFLALAGRPVNRLDRYLAAVGDRRYRDLADLPWYAPSEATPWPDLPTALTAGEARIDVNALSVAAAAAGIEARGAAAAVVFADEFNRQMTGLRNKAALSFGFVARHLDAIWQRYGDDHPQVVIDRQGGRTHYRELLMQSFPAAALTVLEESDAASVYRLAAGDRSMTVRFATGADADHLPVALASMVAKYTRELLMHRLQRWFSERLPEVKPTAGYGADGKRFREEVTPRLKEIGVDGAKLFRNR